MIDLVKSLEVRHWLHALRNSYMYHCHKLTHCAIILCSILLSYLGNSNPGHFLKCSGGGGGMGKGCGMAHHFHGCIVNANDSKF